MNRGTFITTILFASLLLADASRADAPATEFFAIETAKLVKLAPTDSALDTLSSLQLSNLSIAHGWYDGGLSMRFSTGKFRIDARFTGHADFKGTGASSIGYHIDASTNQHDWNLLAVDGAAKKLGRQFVTEDWRKQNVTVVLRYLNLKH